MSDVSHAVERTIKDFARFDLNLLVVFHALYELRHVGRAAQILGLSQPAVSHSLKRLRSALKDPLFVRNPQGVLPTPKAQALAPEVSRILASVQGRVLEPQHFDPLTLDRTFVVRTTGVVGVLLLRKLVSRLAIEAPKVRIALREATPELPQMEIEHGLCDLAIAGYFARVPPGFRSQTLYKDTYLSAVRRGHPRILQDHAPNIDEFCHERHLLIAPGGILEGQIDRALRRLNKERFVAAGVSEYLASGWIVSDSDCVLTAPASLIRQFQRPFDLHVFPPPMKLEPIVNSQVWHERQHTDAAHAWFRGLVASVFQGTDECPPARN